MALSFALCLNSFTVSRTKVSIGQKKIIQKSKLKFEDGAEMKTERTWVETRDIFMKLLYLSFEFSVAV